jgi:zinc protease
MLRLRFSFLLALIIALSLPAAAPAMTIDRVVTPGGIEAWLVRDRSIPVLSVEFSFRNAGGAFNPSGRDGTAALLASMLIEGAGDYDSSRFQATLEDRSISLGFDSGLDSFGGNLKTLNENLDTAVELLRLALTAPRFEADDLQRVKTRAITALRRASEEPRTIASQTWMATAFPDHPYGLRVRGTPESVEALTADDLRAFLRTRLAHDNLVVGVSGDIEKEALGPLLDRMFGGLPARAAPASVPEITPVGGGRTIVIRRQVPQSVVTFGHGGIKRDDPDYYAATVVSYIFGGGSFSSRLTNEVREKRGLAYSVYASLAPYDRTGLILGGTATENARVAQSIEVISQEWRRIRDDGPTEVELADAKTYLTGSFALSLDSSGRIARLLVSMQYDRLGIDYVDKRSGFINSVTLADARRVARRLYDPDKLLTVVVGEPDGIAAASGAQ